MTRSRASEKYAVGQQVWIYDVNGRGRGPERGTVAKVGRQLVTVEWGHRYSRQFRIDGGRINDNYGHHWLKTDDERARDERRASAVATLAAAKVRLDHGCPLALDVIERLAALVAEAGQA